MIGKTETSLCFSGFVVRIKEGRFIKISCRNLIKSQPMRA